MTDIIRTIENLPELLPLKPASKADIADAESRLRVTFSDEYKEYLAAFGAIMAEGVELTGIATARHRNVVLITKQEWDLNKNIPHTMYVVESTGVDGIVIWQSTGGEIFKTAPGLHPERIAPSLNAYLRERLK